MATIKCVGCYDLLREELDVGGKKLVVYNCPRFFPYACAISGLLRPSTGILKAAEICPEDPLSHCAVCSDTKISHYGQDIVSICSEHDDAWGKFLDEHPERRAYLAPRGRSVKANWVEVFREFVEDSRASV
ncbi:hypothetical protein LCGC14_1072030 [marine sediment metagenome]|uniref:Uncharacterized protein n=1 Tax=marine sediment metagenome TaxID=412755 RepID=A0A0F9QNR9_9ZZZZ